MASTKPELNVPELSVGGIDIFHIQRASTKPELNVPELIAAFGGGLPNRHASTKPELNVPELTRRKTHPPRISGRHASTKPELNVPELIKGLASNTKDALLQRNRNLMSRN
ncbi:MAG: hypothetical protein RI964_39 [Pseudomonadota bacterium]